MATTTEINFVVDAIIGAGFTAQTWPASLRRTKLAQDLAVLQSAERNLRAAYAAAAQAYNDALGVNQASQAAKQAEIDAL